LALKIKVAQITIKRNLKELQSEKVISRQGNNKVGSWIIMI